MEHNFTKGSIVLRLGLSNQKRLRAAGVDSCCECSMSASFYNTYDATEWDSQALYKISCIEEKHLFQSHCALTMFSINKVFDIQRLECDSVSYKEMCKSYDYLQ